MPKARKIIIPPDFDKDEFIRKNGITAYYDYMAGQSPQNIQNMLDDKKSRAMKPKTNYKVEQGKFSSIDFCNTPEHALDPLRDFLFGSPLPKWESAMGKGNLFNAMVDWGMRVYGSDIQGGIDFFTWSPPEKCIQVTNPPFGLKKQWTQRSYELGMPFALLMPVEFLGTQGLHKLWRKYGQTQHIFFTQRINFDMPVKGLEGPDGWKSSAQFPTCWYCFGLDLPKDNMVYDLKEGAWWI